MPIDKPKITPADRHPLGIDDPGHADDGPIRTLLGFFMRIGANNRRERVRLTAGPDGISPSDHLTARHMAAISQLFLYGSMTVGELAQRLDVTYATVSLVATDIERAGLISRERDPADGRRVVLHLDPRVGQHLMTRRMAPMQRTLERLTAEEVAVWIKAMGIFAEEVESAVNPSTNESERS